MERDSEIRNNARNTICVMGDGKDDKGEINILNKNQTGDMKRVENNKNLKRRTTPRKIRKNARKRKRRGQSNHLSPDSMLTLDNGY